MAPEHTDAGDAEALTPEGAPFTVTAVVVAVELPQLLIAVTVYMPADNVLTITDEGFNAELKPLGPLHE